eukprot:5171117-Amphidinium_carterae.1
MSSPNTGIGCQSHGSLCTGLGSDDDDDDDADADNDNDNGDDDDDDDYDEDDDEDDVRPMKHESACAHMWSDVPNFQLFCSLWLTV